MTRIKRGFEGFRRQKLIQAGVEAHIRTGTTSQTTTKEIVNRSIELIEEELPYESYPPKTVLSMVTRQFGGVSALYESIFDEIFQNYGDTFNPSAEAEPIDSLWVELHAQAKTYEWKPKLINQVREHQDSAVQVFIVDALQRANRRVKDGYSLDELCVLIKSLENGMKIRSLGNKAISSLIELEPDTSAFDTDRASSLLKSGIKAIFDEFTESK